VQHESTQPQPTGPARPHTAGGVAKAAANARALAQALQRPGATIDAALREW